MSFSRQQLEKLQKEGKIKGFTWPMDKATGKPAKVEPRNISKAKKWINVQLTEWGMRKGIMILREFMFSPEDNWRFDWAFIIPATPEHKEVKGAVEYEGGIFMAKSGHNTAKHYTKDTKKYNKAQELGWIVLRYTSITHKNLVTDLENIDRCPR